MYLIKFFKAIEIQKLKFAHMIFKYKMLSYFIPCCGGIIMEGCVWYTIFNWMGCIDNEPEQVQPRPQQPVSQPPNPFIHTGLPKNPHLLPAYN
jgi:hypothetical protein